jgi:hypothetical protein
MKFKNIKVYGLDESCIRSGYPHQITEPIDLSGIMFKSDLTLLNAKERLYKLAKAPNGSGHDCALKGVVIQFDMSYPQYFTPQLQRYHWIDIVSSQSKMHSLTKIKDIKNSCNKYVCKPIINLINELIEVYNKNEFPLNHYWNLDSDYRNIIETKEELFQYIISNLPMGFELWMGISTNYLQLKTIYNQRKSHKLEEWKEFCKFIEELPMFELITGKE